MPQLTPSTLNPVQHLLDRRSRRSHAADTPISNSCSANPIINPMLLIRLSGTLGFGAWSTHPAHQTLPSDFRHSIESTDEPGVLIRPFALCPVKQMPR
jgi:hypothetical protein